MFGLGGSEILVILIVTLIFISPDKIPEIAQWLGRTIWKIKHTAEEFRKEVAIPGLGLDQTGLRDELNTLRELRTDLKNTLESPIKTLGSSLLEEKQEEDPNKSLCESTEEPKPQ